MKHGITLIYAGILAAISLQLACSSNKNGNETTPSTEKAAKPPTAPAPMPTDKEEAKPPEVATPKPVEPASADDGTFDPDRDLPPPAELASRDDCIKRQANVFKLTEAATWRKLEAAQRQAKLDEWARDNADSFEACQTGDKVIVTCQAEAKDLEEYEVCRGG